MKWIAAVVVAFAAIGCSGGGSSSTPDAAADDTKAPAIVAPEPATTEPTQVGLVRNDDVVHVGTETEKAIEILKAGAQGGFSSERLPDGFTSPYQSHVWQAGESGFGILSFKGKVVMAMVQDGNSTPDHLSALRLAMQNLVGEAKKPTVIEGSKVSYWFWHDAFNLPDGKSNGQTMMIMAFQKESGKIYIASAMGDDAVLNTLGINETQAKKDQADADQIIQKMESEKNKTNKSKG